jgi:hypothetical protein
MIEFKYDDGGRAAAGFKGHTNDCVTRAIAIVTGRPYAEVYAEMADLNAGMRLTKKRLRNGKTGAGKRTASHGIWTSSKAYKDYMARNGFVWTSTMQIGSGCKVHVRKDELPSGRLILVLSRHHAAMIDGVLHDIDDDSRGGTRCVYGYYRLQEEFAP